MTADARPLYALPRATEQAIEADHVREARTTLADEYERGHEAGRLVGRLEAVVLTAIGAAAGLCVWLVLS